MDSVITETYADVESFLYNLPKFTKKNSLEHTKDLLSRLGNPSLDIPKVHVAGTNGKGSVCAYLQSLFHMSGKKTGGFVSPHLVTMHERFLIQGEPVSNERFMEAFRVVKNMADGAQTDGLSYPTFFEFLFLMGMYIFEKERVEILVLETGLGGRLDATNIFNRVEVCVITSIGLDHCMYLGNTREAIASEKAGIIKTGSAVVFCDTSDSVSNVICEKSTEKHAFADPLGQKDYYVEKIKHKSIDFSYKSGYYNYISLFVPTCALYQVENAALALKAFEICTERLRMTRLSVEQMREALSRTFWQGRMEEVLPNVYFDGAHNEDGIQAFLETVKTMDVKGRRILCFSAVDDKDYGRMISMLGESRLFSHITAVEMEEERGVGLCELRQLMSRYDCWIVDAVVGAETGLMHVLEQKRPEDVVYIVGSLYLVGLVKAVLRRN